jgi:tRNA pseudouridine38-40 synthase
MLSAQSSVRLLLTLQYLGTRYAGWQAQANATGVQQIVEEALAKLFNEPVRLHGAGRTDAGVHAAAQRAHFDAPFAIPPRGLLLGINQLLPHDVRVAAVQEVPDGFHARFSATSKTYVYRIWNSEVMDVFAFETHAHVAQRLEVATMRDAALVLYGKHDFAPFTVADPEVESTVRTVNSIGVERRDDIITVTISADGFLRYMVRRIAGSLIEIGRGKLDAARLFDEARWTAPAKGLMLLHVGY